MNAVMQGTAEEGEPGTMCMVLQKGYKLGRRVIRHAMVKELVARLFIFQYKSIEFLSKLFLYRDRRTHI